MTMTLHSLVGALVVRSREEKTTKKPYTRRRRRKERETRDDFALVVSKPKAVSSRFRARARLGGRASFGANVLPAQTRVRSTDVVIIIAFKSRPRRTTTTRPTARERGGREATTRSKAGRKPEQQRKGGRTWSTMTTRRERERSVSNCVHRRPISDQTNKKYAKENRHFSPLCATTKTL